MYNISQHLKDLYKNYKRQIVSIHVQPRSGESFNINESDIVQGSLSVNRYSASAEKIEIGSAISSELTFSLKNHTGKFDDVKFEGADLHVVVGIAGEGSSSYINLGQFRVDNPPRKKSVIEISALDRMRRFDQMVDVSLFANGMTIGSYVNMCCAACGMTLTTNLSTLPNVNYSVTEVPDGLEDNTYRQILQWCGAIMGVCAYIDWYGALCFGWYKSSSDLVITPSDRYDTDIFENDITITGISTNVNGDTFVSGTDDYTIDIIDNPLLQHDIQTVLDNIGSVIIGFTYRPYSCETKPLPHVYPLDYVTIVDKKGVSHPSVVTNITFKVNKHTQMQAQGLTSEDDSYYNPNLTSNEALILSKIRKEQQEMSEILNERATSQLQLNSIIANAIGLYFTTITDNIKGTLYYYHDAESMADSNVIYTFNAGGFAWTDDWNNGNPVWQYGISSNGNAVLNYLSVNKLTADYIDVQSLIASGEFVARHIENGEVKTLLSITANGLEINSEKFKLTTEGVITATGGTIAGFTIDENCLTNSDGTSYITIAYGDYSSTISSSRIGIVHDVEIAGESNTEGSFISPTRMWISKYMPSLGILSGCSICANYKNVDYNRPDFYTSHTITSPNNTLKGVSINAKKFADAVNKSDGTYTFFNFATANGNFYANWQLNSTSVNLANYGISITSGSAGMADQIAVTLTQKYDTNSIYYEGCIEPTAENGSFILGSYKYRDPSYLVYERVCERGSYLKFVDYQKSQLCFDSKLSGKWTMKDTARTDEWGVSAPHIESAGTTSVYYLKGSNVPIFNHPADGTYTGSYKVVACGDMKIIFIEYIGGSDGAIAQDGWYYVKISDLASFTTVLGCTAMSATDALTKLEGVTRSNQFVTTLNRNYIHVGCDDNTARGFRAIVFVI